MKLEPLHIIEFHIQSRVWGMIPLHWSPSLGKYQEIYIGLVPEDRQRGVQILSVMPSRRELRWTQGGNYAPQFCWDVFWARVIRSEWCRSIRFFGDPTGLIVCRFVKLSRLRRKRRLSSLKKNRKKCVRTSTSVCQSLGQCRTSLFCCCCLLRLVSGFLDV